MTVYEVWEQWPLRPIVSFRTLEDAIAFKAITDIAMPIILRREV